MELLKLKSEIDSIEIAQCYIEEIVEKHSQFSSIFANIHTAVSEALNNAIVHGNSADPSKIVQLSYEVEKDKIRFRVEDEGNGFDFNSIPDPTLPENIEKISGRGVFIIRTLADNVVFEEGGRIVIIEFDKPAFNDSQT